MNSTKGLFIFLVGTAVGAATTWLYLSDRYEKYVQEEIDSVKAAFEDRKPLPIETDIPENTKEAEQATDICKENGYTEYSSIHKKDPVKAVPKRAKKKKASIRVISPEEFSTEEEYETVSLVYYADGVLADDVNEVVEDADILVGNDFETHFGEYLDDCVYVRNDERKIDYEIVIDYRTYAESIK